jgi:membrane protein required for colicin V production
MDYKPGPIRTAKIVSLFLMKYIRLFLLKNLLMGVLDIIFGAFLIYGIYKGIRNGLFVELASLVSFIIGIYTAVKFSYMIRNSVSAHVPGSPKTIQIIAFVLTFIIVVIGISILAKAFTKIADFAFLGCLNHLAGGLFGMLRMMLFLGILMGLLLKTSYHDGLISKNVQEKSLLFKPVAKTSEFILPVLKNWFEDLKKQTTSTP